MISSTRLHCPSPYAFVVFEPLIVPSPVLADALARCGRPALTAQFTARAFDVQCLFECVRSWAGDCFVFGGIAGSGGAGGGSGGGGVGGLHGVDAAEEAPLALTLYLLDIMLFLGAWGDGLFALEC